MKSKKGFTLVELLVVIVILGILTGISIPIIRNIQENNTKKEYTSYMESMKYSAKLYVNSYEEDLFGRKKSGCAIISYESMKERGLLKDIPLDDVSCDTKDTYVKVVKIGDKYGYSVSIGCGKKDSSGNVTIDLKDAEMPTDDLDICTTDATSIMTISGVPGGSDSYLGKRANMNVRITSNTGVLNNANIQYGFSTAQDTNVIDGWKTLPISVMGLNDQKKLIEKGNQIALTSDKIITPDNQTGSLYLVLKINTLQDLYEYEWNSDPAKQGVFYIGPYKVDNTKPTCTVNKTLTGSTAGVSATITCSDGESGCTSESTFSKTGLTSTQTYTISDKAKNTNTCTVSVSSQVQQQTRDYGCTGGYKTQCTSEGQDCSGYDPSSCVTYTGVRKSTCDGYKTSGKIVTFHDWSNEGTNNDLGDCQVCNVVCKTVCNRYEDVCQGRGWFGWTSWANVTSCTPDSSSSSHQVACRTIYS